MAINTSRKLRFRKNGATYSLNLLSPSDISGGGWPASLRVRIDGGEWCVPAESGSASNALCFRKGGATYHCVNATPTLTFTFTNSTDRNTYQQVTAYNKKLTKVSTSIRLSTALDIYMSANAGSSWTKVATLSAGSLSVSPNYTMSNSTGGNFGVRAVTQVRYTRITGTVRWSGAEILLGSAITASVSLNSALPVGKIYVTGEWNSLVPPFHTEGSSNVLSAGSKSGSATREFVTSGLTCSMKLYYDPQTSGVSTQKIAEYTWASLGAIGVNRTDSLSFDAVATSETARTIAENKALTASAASWSAAVPQAYW